VTKALAVLSLAFGLSAIAHADPLKGSTVRADGFSLADSSQTNLFPDTIDKIGSGKEFSFDDGLVTYSANFNPTGLTLRANCDTGVSLKKCNTDPGAGFFFKDNVFVGATFDPDPASTLMLSGGGVLPGNGKTIFLVIAPDTFTSKNSKFILDITPLATSPVPEPNSIVLFGTGLLGFAGTFRRRFRA
jgi:hypothetical protein